MLNEFMPSSVSEWLGLWGGLIAGLIGIATGAYFSLISIKKRKLVYCVNPVRTRVVTSGQATDLKVFYRSEPLGDTDVSAVQLEIWNAGNESIRKGNILKDITVFTDPPIRILEASIRSQSRDVVKFTLPDSNEIKGQGKVRVSWDILEKNDGASIQLLYLGKPAVNITVGGTIEGLQPIKRITTTASSISVRDRKKEIQKHRIQTMGVGCLALISFLLNYILGINNDLLYAFFVITTILFLFMLLVILNEISERLPPFDF